MKKIRTSITPTLMRYALFKGSVMAIIGVILLIYAGTFFSISMLSRWGLLIWIIGLCCIALGLIPYKILQKRMLQPDEIIVDDNELLHYLSRGKHVFSYAIRDIIAMNYKDYLLNYGIDLSFKDDGKYFLPYFSKKAFLELDELLLPD